MVNRVGAKKKGLTKKKSGFVYKKRTADDVKKRAEQSGGGFDSPFKKGIDTFRPKDGENQIRILPPTHEDADHYGLDVWMHRWVGADNSNYLCPEKMLNKKCPICDEMREAKSAGEEDEAKALTPQKRTLVWVLDRDDDSNTPQVWDMSWSQDRDIAALTHSQRTGKVLLIDHPDTGYDVIVKKTGKGLKTRYSYQIERDESPISEKDKEQSAVLEYIEENPLTDVLRYDTVEKLEKVLSGTTVEKDEDLDDEDEDDKKKKKKKSKSRRRDDDDDSEEEPRRKKKSRRDDDDEDEEEDSEEEDEEEEEEEDRSSRRKSKSKRSRGDDDDEEEEEDDESEEEEDEDEEEEESTRKRKGKSKTKSKSRSRDDDDEEEEEEEEDDEDEEEEEQPRRRRRK